jgi:hypothetical protein
MRATAAERGSAQPRPVVRCALCGHSCSLDEWRSQPVERTLTRIDLAGYVSDWPLHVTVQVRPCGACGVPIARKAGATE